MRLPPEPDVVSSYSTNSVREQLRQVNQRIDEVQRDFVRSKEEVGETTKDGSPFALEILDKPILSSFQLPALAPYDGSTDPTEHVTAFRAQMALYDTSEALMITRNPEVISPKDNLPGHPEEGIGRSYWPPNLSRSCSIQPELRRYYRFHRDYDHDIDECNNLRNQIEDLIRQGISIASSEIGAPPGNAPLGQEPLSSTEPTS
ncbi:hypothetical protein BHM03_00032512 [Ensete ventricosum]|uniref:Uncharacterized protein n=1 Tax=Ensete ventricosum TaxID=4639 RepID=A0A445MIS4_ENSVE|nr:hypothetical protein BHM03_00032512 [Ensete ventricosum]